MLAISENWKRGYRFVVDLSSIVSAAGVIIGLLAGFLKLTSSLKCVNVNISGFMLVSMSVFLISVVVGLISGKESVDVYSDRKRAPKSVIGTNERLIYITRNNLNMTVIGRTNISWFVDVEVKKELCMKALQAGCVITFVIQHELVESRGAKDGSKVEQRQKGREQTIQKFEEMHCFLMEKLGKEVVANFRLWFTMKKVDNSMTVLFKEDGDNGNYYNFFSYDMGLTLENNPYVVFRDNSVIQELKDKFAWYQEDYIDFFEYKLKCGEGKNEIWALLARYPEFSVQRKNDNRKLLYHYFKRRERITRGEERFYPPISIQLLITNVCTTTCVMCDHHKVGNRNELDHQEIKNVLDYICDLGTKNVVVSGGEPLSKNNCIDLLEYAKGKGLNVGLLTNGIKQGNESLSADDAKRVKESCKWVQLSIDSFDKDTYRSIRNADLEVVKQSAQNLKTAGANLEIAFSIQKLNISEAVDIVTEGKSPISDVKIRFKFANGLNGKKDFLLADDDASKLRSFVAGGVNSGCFNTDYIRSMLDQGFFTYESIISGKPLTIPTRYLNKKKDKCHVLNYTCKIAANGEVYPCCYLYDPNAGNDSKIRNEYSIGSLRSPGTNLVQKLTGDRNLLKEVLLSEAGRNNENIMPILHRVCSCCTRHFYQNAFWNDLDSVVEKYENYDIWDESYCDGVDDLNDIGI